MVPDPNVIQTKRPSLVYWHGKSNLYVLAKEI